MVSLKSVEHQLKEIGCNFKFWGRPEIVELAKILMPDEKIAQCVNGTYEGGFALLAATDQRILLVDKKPMYLTLDDIRYDMVSDINFSHRLLDASIHIMTSGNKTLNFRAYSQPRLRKIMDHVQHSVTLVRSRHDHAQKAEAKIADEIEEVEKNTSDDRPALQQLAQQPTQPQFQPVMAQPQPHHQLVPAMQQMATENNTASYDGFRRHIALQIAHYIGPRAVMLSQLPPTLSRYKLPLARRPFTKSTT